MRAETAKAGLPVLVLAQVAWALLSALWNVAGAYRLSQGVIALGPTASLPVAAGLVALAAVQDFSWKRSTALYIGLSALFALGALAAVFGALTKRPTALALGCLAVRRRGPQHHRRRCVPDWDRIRACEGTFAIVEIQGGTVSLELSGSS